MSGSTTDRSAPAAGPGAAEAGARATGATAAPEIVRGAIPPAAAEGAAQFTGRTWVIDQVSDWATNGSERFLIVVGEPGWGKSALVAWLVGPDPSATPAAAPSGGHAPAAPPPIPWSAWHFCAAALDQTVNPFRFSTSMAVQLGSRYGAYGYAIVKRSAPEINVDIAANKIDAPTIGIKTRAITINASDAREVYDQAVREPLQAVVAAGQHEGPIFLAVDGLDDALEFSSPNIVDLIAGSNDFPDAVRFLVTTREEPRVLGPLTESLDAASYRVIYVSDPDDEPTVRRNDADVRAYVERQLEGLSERVHIEAAAIPALVDGLVELANGNFLVARFLLRQVNQTGALPEGVPKGLYPLYGAYLRRLLPETARAGISDKWRKDYQPLLGTLSVARPAAPEALIPDWLGRRLGWLKQVLPAVGQIVEYLDDQRGSRRLYHRSLAEFLALPDIPGPVGDPQPNRYFVEPREQHDKIARYYLSSLEKRWGANWKNADDYGLRQLVPHLYALYRLTADPAERDPIARQLCDLALDDGFQIAQREKLGGANATIEACRLAIEVSLESEPIETTRARVRRLAQSWEPEIRILAARILDRLSQSDRAGVLAELKGLVR